MGARDYTDTKYGYDAHCRDTRDAGRPSDNAGLTPYQRMLEERTKAHLEKKNKAEEAAIKVLRGHHRY